MTIWFTADLHLGHKNILEYCNRPWETIEEHDAAILQNWHDTVKDGDLVYVLGDVVMGSIKKYAERLDALPGQKHLIAGNHDRIWRGIEGWSDKKNYDAMIAAGFTSWAQANRISNANYLGWDYNDPVRLDHFPSEGESVAGKPDRFAEYRPHDHGYIILCGHVHDQWVTTGFNINVGVDVRNYRPVSAVELRSEARMVLEGMRNGAQV